MKDACFKDVIQRELYKSILLHNYCCNIVLEYSITLPKKKVLYLFIVPVTAPVFMSPVLVPLPSIPRPCPTL